jgi:hypothetical protein
VIQPRSQQPHPSRARRSRTRPPPAVGAARLHKRRLANAKRQRYRKRLKADLIVVPVIVTHAVIGLLLDLGWLTEADSEDRSHIGQAIAALLSDTANHQ